MKRKFYGALLQNEIKNNVDRHLERIKYKGFSIIENAVPAAMVSELKNSAFSMNESQKIKFGEEQLEKIGENNQVRLPLLYDTKFLDLLQLTSIAHLLDALFAPTKSFYVLNQQNVILNMGSEIHNQASWHRDFPYLSGVQSIPQAYSVLVALDNFTRDNGGTRLLQGSHLHDVTPSWEFIDEECTHITCDAGSAIVFNSQVFHASGINETSEPRLAINNVFTNPLYRQQIDIPSAMSGKAVVSKLTETQKRLLGFSSKTASSDEELKAHRKGRSNA